MWGTIPTSHRNSALQRQQFEGFAKELQHFCNEQYVRDKGGDLDPDNLKDTKLGSPSWESGLESRSHGKSKIEFSWCLGLLIHRSGYSHLRSCLKVEMELGEVKIRVWVMWNWQFWRTGLFRFATHQENGSLKTIAHDLGRAWNEQLSWVLGEVSIWLLI